MLDEGKELFRTYAFWAGILVVKTMTLGVLTSITRLRKGVFVSPEDKTIINFVLKKSRVAYDDPDIERVRRAHLNDLENIIPFLIISLLYTCINPSLTTASLLIKTYTFARIVHSFVYAVYPLPQPARLLAYAVGTSIQWYMAIQVMLYFY